jgi:transposase
MVAALEAWRVQDRHLGEWVAQARDQMTRRRREVYRTVASRLAAAYGTVIVEKFELPRLGREPSRETEADYQQDAGRALARMAAPGGLRHALTQAAVREGGRVLTVPAEGTTRVHAPCDTWLEADFAASRSVWCDGCGTMFDQDFNAAENLLRLATGEVTEMRRPAA